MTRELSALLDGELERHEISGLWSDVRANSELRSRWMDYQLIGAVLRRDDATAVEMTAGVMRSLEEEPVIFSPTPRTQESWRGSALAMAASAAGVAIVAWLALAPQNPASERATSIVRLEKAPTVAAPTPSQGVGEYREYLLAHQANAPGLHMQGGAQHIRTVSAFVGAQ